MNKVLEALLNILQAIFDKEYSDFERDDDDDDD